MSSFINGAEAVEKKKFGKTENIVERKPKEERQIECVRLAVFLTETDLL
jgi:hypothetical protein